MPSRERQRAGGDPRSPRIFGRRLLKSVVRRGRDSGWLVEGGASEAGTKAGIAGRLEHDFRRPAVRNLVAGVPERVAMTVTRHETQAVFDRYNIVSPGDLQDVARRLAATFQGTPGYRRVDALSVSNDYSSTRL